jgi:hypothetical protein
MSLPRSPSRAHAALTNRNGHSTESEKFRELMADCMFRCPSNADTTTVLRQYMPDEELGFDARTYGTATRRIRGKQVIVISSADEESLKQAADEMDECRKARAASVHLWVPDGLGTEHKDMKAWCGDDLRRFTLAVTLVRPWEQDVLPEDEKTLKTYSRTPPSDGEEEVEPPIELPEWPAPLGEDAYLGLLGDIVHGIEKETEADPSAILMQLVVAFGNLIGRSAYARVGRAFHYTNEFLLLIGQTSAARKGTAWTEVGAFLESIDEAWWNHLGPGLSTGEGLIFHVRDKVITKEAIKEKSSGLLKGYQDVVTDEGVTDKRLMVVETEFSRALQAMQREGSTLNSIVRQAFDGGLLRSLTKGFPYQATGAHISIIGHITAMELLKLLASTDLANGFFNRFVWGACRRARLLPFGGYLDDAILIGFQNRITAAVEFAKAVEYVKWTRPAMDLWEEQYPLLTAPRPGALGGVVNRAEAHALRWSVLTALFNRESEIGLDHLKAGLEVSAFSERSARFILGDRLEDADEAAVLAYLKCKPDGATRAEIRRGVFNDNKTAQHVRTKLAALLQTGLVRSEPDPSGAKTQDRWFSTSPPT